MYSQTTGLRVWDLRLRAKGWEFLRRRVDPGNRCGVYVEHGPTTLQHRFHEALFSATPERVVGAFRFKIYVIPKISTKP